MSQNKDNFNNSYRLTVNEPAPVNWSIGNGIPFSYDNIRFKTPCGWRKEPCDVGLKKGPLFVPQGTPLPLKDEEIYQYPPSDSMFIFDRNYSSPYCCPSTFSTSTGCVCTTPHQRDYIGTMRGGNKTYPDGNF